MMKAVGENKRCNKCHEWKHVSAFNRNKKSRDGLQYRCRPCCAETHVANLERNRESCRKWYAANAEKHKENRRRRYAESGKETDNRIRMTAEYNWMKEKLAELGIQV